MDFFNGKCIFDYQKEGVYLFNDDCLEAMSNIADKSVDLILCDLPYNTNQRITTCNKWDTPIDLDKLWQQYKRIIKDNGAIVLFGNEMLSNDLINSNKSMFRYKWYWDKTRGNNFVNSHYMPMKSIEEITVFYKQLPVYNPQFWYSTPYQTTDRERRKEHTRYIWRKSLYICYSYCIRGW